MKRAKPIQRKTRLKSVNRERAAKRKARDFGEYAEWIREQWCVMLGWTSTYRRIPARKPAHGCWTFTEAAHVKSRGAGGHAECNLIALCTRCHGELHHVGRKSFEAKYGIQLGAIAADLWGRYQRESKGDAA